MHAPLSARLVLALLLAAVSCRPGEQDPRPFEALAAGRALDGREGLELFAPETRDAVLAHAEEEARYWGRGEAERAQLEALLTRHDGTPDGRAALLRDLRAYTATVAVMTESHLFPGIVELAVDGDTARAWRQGENPGGAFREVVRFVRVDGVWYLDGPIGAQD